MTVQLCREHRHFLDQACIKSTVKAQCWYHTRLKWRERLSKLQMLNSVALCHTHDCTRLRRGQALVTQRGAGTCHSKRDKEKEGYGADAHHTSQKCESIQEGESACSSSCRREHQSKAIQRAGCTSTHIRLPDVPTPTLVCPKLTIVSSSGDHHRMYAAHLTCITCSKTCTLNMLSEWCGQAQPPS